MLFRSVRLLEQLVEPSTEIVTLITGTDAPEAVTQSMISWLGENRPGATVEVHRGGQPLYPYLIGVE